MRRRLTLAAILVVGLGSAAPLGAAPDKERPGQPRLVIQTRHTLVVESTGYSRDGRFIITAGGDGIVHIWDSRTGREVRRIKEFSGTFGSAALTADGALAIATMEDDAAILYDVVAGEEVADFAGNKEAPVAISPKGKYVAFGAISGAVQIWKRNGKKPAHTLTGHKGRVRELIFSHDGKELFSASFDGAVRRYSTRGRKMGVYKANGDDLLDMDLSADSRVFITLSDKGAVSVWDTRRTSKPRLVIRPRGEKTLTADISTLALLPDSSGFMIGCQDGSVEHWDLETGKQVAKWAVLPGMIGSLSMSPQGTSAVAGGGQGTAKLIDLATGTMHPLGTTAVAPTDVTISADARTMVVLDDTDRVTVWDLRSGQAVRSPRGAQASCAAVSPSGELVLSASSNSTATIWSAFTGAVVQELLVAPETVWSVAFTPDGFGAFTGMDEGAIHLWDVATGARVRSFEGSKGRIQRIVLSRTGHRVAALSADMTVRLWDVRTGNLIWTRKSSVDPADLALSPDGERVAVCSAQQRVTVYDMKSKRKPLSFPDPDADTDDRHVFAITSLAFSPDGRHILTSSSDHDLRLWNAKTGACVDVIGSHENWATRAIFMPGGKRVVSCGTDGATRIWDVAEQEEIVTLVLGRTPDTTWCVFDQTGRFDANDPEQVQTVHWVRDLRPEPLANLKGPYYDPGLLAKRLGWSREALRAASSPPAPAPTVQLKLRAGPGVVVDVEATDAGGGIGVMAVRLNGKQVMDDARGGTVEHAAVQTFTVDLTNDPRILPGELNTVEINAFNVNGTAKTRGRDVPFVAPGKPVEKRALWAIVCGVSDYAGSEIDLSFAAKDAERFSTALALAAVGHFGAADTHITTLTSPAKEGAVSATRANLLQAFEAARACKSSDVFIVYLAGHGVIAETGPSGYHYLLAGADSLDLGEGAPQTSVSGAELMRLIQGVPAVRRQLLVLDTCAAGQVRDEARAALAGQHARQRSLSTIKDATGMFILAGCAANQVSYESTQFDQGLLTYTILHALRCGCEFKDSVFIDVSKLLRYVWEYAPIFGAQVEDAGSQRPVRLEGDVSFVIGKLSQEDRVKIPLQTAKPRLIRSSLQEEEAFADVRSLTPAINAAIEGLPGAREGKAPVLFTDTYAMADTYRIAGRYSVRNGRTTVQLVVLYADNEGTAAPIGKIKLVGKSRRPAQREALASEIVTKALEVIQKHFAK